jgi:ParB family chromosome partitioning protein
MARKNPFAHLLDDTGPEPDPSVMTYPIKGASRSLISSIDELASRANSLLEGETVAELDPDIVDPSFVKDRLADEDQDFSELLAAIRERGQDTPILVRPHPQSAGRYMVVFGHRRVRAAKLLGRKVRAVVRDLKDREHVVAQGQENSARANLSFIERARFAAMLTNLHYDDDGATVLAALTIDRATLSKMLSVATIPTDIIDAVGATKGTGRDRWYSIKQLLDKPSLLEAARTFLRQPELHAQSCDDRFNALMAHLAKLNAPGRRTKAPFTKRTWKPVDGALSAKITSAGKRFDLVLTAKSADARAFGEYVSENLNRLYEAFRQGNSSTRNGD